MLLIEASPSDNVITNGVCSSKLAIDQANFHVFFIWNSTKTFYSLFTGALEIRGNSNGLVRLVVEE